MLNGGLRPVDLLIFGGWKPWTLVSKQWTSKVYRFHIYRGTVRRPASRLSKLSRRVPNHSGRVPFYTGAFRTVSAGVANADSALPYLNGTSTQDIINAEFMKEHKKTA